MIFSIFFEATFRTVYLKIYPITQVAFTSSQLSLYLDKPPVGISPVLWEQAKQENPDPVKLIPVPLVGFKAISERLRLQKEQSEAHFARVELIG